MKTNALHRNNRGLCTPVSLALIDGGMAPDPAAYDVTLSDEQTTIQGWGHLDGRALVYEGPGDWAYLVPLT